MSELYDDDFYRGNRTGSKTSAQVMVPIIRDLIAPASVLDVGCGVGTWASVWLEAGLDDVVAVDGSYVNERMLQIPAEKFLGRDLAKPLDLGRKFDLVTCLEVAEHLPHDSAGTLVASLTRHADAVVFSAAVPRQGGTGHINEQWPSYWAKQFEKFGFRGFDPFRAQVWDNQEVEWWYRQNTLLFVKENCPLAERMISPSGPIDVVHPFLFESWARESSGVVALRRSIASSRVGRAIRGFRDTVRPRNSTTGTAG